MYLRHDHAVLQGGGGARSIRQPVFGRLDGPRVRDVSIAVDLGDRIGSPTWFRRLFTLAAMLFVVVRMAPGVVPLPASAPALLAPAAEEEMRAVGIAPLALGGDSGRTIAPTVLAAPLSSTPERPELDLTATLRGGDGLARMLVREGALPADAVAAAALVDADAPHLASGTKVGITLGRRPAGGTARPVDRVTLRARLDLALAVRRDGSRLVLERQPIAVDATPLRIVGAVGYSLYRAARTAGVPLPVLAEYLRAIAKHIDIDDIAADDRFDIVLEHRRAATGEIETGALLYAGLTHGGKALQLTRWNLDGRPQWFDADGAGDRHEGLSLPVDGRVSSSFGMRFHPILGFSRMHQGVDLAAPEGAPIVAASDGVVRFAGWHGGHGNYVQLVHGGGLMTGYGHMSRFAVAAGDTVRQGQLIGYVGSTGLSTGPHCHFEVFRNGEAIDPLTASFATVTRVPAAEYPAFRAALARYAALPVGGAAQVAAK